VLPTLSIFVEEKAYITQFGKERPSKQKTSIKKVKFLSVLPIEGLGQLGKKHPPSLPAGGA